MNSSFAKLSFITLPLIAFSACQDYDPLGEEGLQKLEHQKALEATINEYTKNFEARYGKIDPNHSWGFDVKPYNYVASSTRAQSVNVARNQWYTIFDNIPGFPFSDDEFPNLYQQETTVGGNQHGSKFDYNLTPIDDKLTPGGDVTDFEIQYVSYWFRSHEIKNPENYREALHITDFFVQNVSADADQDNYPFGNNKTHTGTDQNTFEMDDLYCKEIGGAEFNTVNPQGWEHVNEFNSKTSNIDPENHLGDTETRIIRYVSSGGTEDFAYHPSFDASGTIGFYDNWVLIKLEWDEPKNPTKVGTDAINWSDFENNNDKLADFLEHPSKYNFETVHRVGYYLAFDYEAYKSGENAPKANPDHYYSNWIIKISPASFKPVGDWPRRIMCEDLGNTCDFDFNDVVYDVNYVQHSSHVDAVITLRAAGGTMPICVAKEAYNSDLEAHSLLEAPNVTTPVNVGGFEAPHGFARYRIHDCTDGKLDEIKIFVNKQTAGSTSTEAYQVSATQKGNNNAPQMFACPPTVRWMEENQYIEWGYDHFKDWVQDEHGAYRENKNDDQASASWKKAWFNSLADGADSHLFGNAQPSNDPENGGGSQNDEDDPEDDDEPQGEVITADQLSNGYDFVVNGHVKVGSTYTFIVQLTSPDAFAMFMNDQDQIAHYGGGTPWTITDITIKDSFDLRLGAENVTRITIIEK